MVFKKFKLAYSGEEVLINISHITHILEDTNGSSMIRISGDRTIVVDKSLKQITEELSKWLYS